MTENDTSPAEGWGL